MRETFYETILRDTSPQMECIIAAHVQLLTPLYGKAPHSYLYIYIYIYKTETFEALIIFHVSTILKKKKTFLKPSIIKKKKNTQKFQLKKIAKSLKP